jgi:hypothetical protein
MESPSSPPDDLQICTTCNGKKYFGHSHYTASLNVIDGIRVNAFIKGWVNSGQPIHCRGACGVPGDWILYAGMSNSFFDGTTVRSGIVYIPVAPYLSFTDYWGALS